MNPLFPTHSTSCPSINHIGYTFPKYVPRYFSQTPLVPPTSKFPNFFFYFSSCLTGLHFSSCSSKSIACPAARVIFKTSIRSDQSPIANLRWLPIEHRINSLWGPPRLYRIQPCNFSGFNRWAPAGQPLSQHQGQCLMQRMLTNSLLCFGYTSLSVPQAQ